MIPSFEMRAESQIVSRETRISKKIAKRLPVDVPIYFGGGIFRGNNAAKVAAETEFEKLFPEISMSPADFFILARSKSAKIQLRYFWHGLVFLKYAFNYSTEEFSEAIGLSKSSWERKFYKDEVSKSVYDRVFVLARLYAIALDVLDDLDSVRLWFKSPNPALGGESPHLLAMGEPGTGIVLNQLEAMREGVYS